MNKVHDISDIDYVCCICQENLKQCEIENQIKRLECGHCIHTNCYNDLITYNFTNCPLCNHNIEIKQNQVRNIQLSDISDMSVNYEPSCCLSINKYIIQKYNDLLDFIISLHFNGYYIILCGILWVLFLYKVIVTIAVEIGLMKNYPTDFGWYCFNPREIIINFVSIIILIVLAVGYQALS